MPRYIDAEREIKEIETVLEIKREEGFGEDDPAFYALMRFAENLRKAPTANVAPVVHAHWDDVYSPMGEMGWKFACSVCNGWAQVRTKFCAHCGAKMDGWQP